MLKIDNKLQQIVEFQHVAGQGPRVRAHEAEDVVRQDHRQDVQRRVKVETATVDRRDMTFLYRDGEDYVLMDEKTYDQINLAQHLMGDAARFLLENTSVQVSFHEGEPLFAELPVSVDLTVSQTDPGLQGDRSTGGTKPATLETGAEVQVPLFIETGDVLKIDTRDGSYLSRVNN